MYPDEFGNWRCAWCVKNLGTAGVYDDGSVKRDCDTKS